MENRSVGNEKQIEGGGNYSEKGARLLISQYKRRIQVIYRECVDISLQSAFVEKELVVCLVIFPPMGDPLALMIFPVVECLFPTTDPI